MAVPELRECTLLRCSLSVESGEFSSRAEIRKACLERVAPGDLLELDDQRGEVERIDRQVPPSNVVDSLMVPIRTPLALARSLRIRWMCVRISVWLIGLAQTIVLSTRRICSSRSRASTKNLVAQLRVLILAVIAPDRPGPADAPAKRGIRVRHIVSPAQIIVDPPDRLAVRIATEEV